MVLTLRDPKLQRHLQKILWLPRGDHRVRRPNGPATQDF